MASSAASSSQLVGSSLADPPPPSQSAVGTPLHVTDIAPSPRSPSSAPPTPSLRRTPATPPGTPYPTVNSRAMQIATPAPVFSESGCTPLFIPLGAPTLDAQSSLKRPPSSAADEEREAKRLNKGPTG